MCACVIFFWFFTLSLSHFFSTPFFIFSVKSIRRRSHNHKPDIGGPVAHTTTTTTLARCILLLQHPSSPPPLNSVSSSFLAGWPVGGPSRANWFPQPTHSENSVKDPFFPMETGRVCRFSLSRTRTHVGKMSVCVGVGFAPMFTFFPPPFCFFSLLPLFY